MGSGWKHERQGRERERLIRENVKERNEII